MFFALAGGQAGMDLFDRRHETTPAFVTGYREHVFLQRLLYRNREAIDKARQGVM